MDASDVIHGSLLGQLLIVFLFKAEQGLRHALDILQMVGSFLLERILIQYSSKLNAKFWVKRRCLIILKPHYKQTTQPVRIQHFINCNCGYNCNKMGFLLLQAVGNNLAQHQLKALLTVHDSLNIQIDRWSASKQNQYRILLNSLSRGNETTELPSNELSAAVNYIVEKMS